MGAVPGVRLLDSPTCSFLIVPWFAGNGPFPMTVAQPWIPDLLIKHAFLRTKDKNVNLVYQGDFGASRLEAAHVPHSQIFSSNASGGVRGVQLRATTQGN